MTKNEYAIFTNFLANLTKKNTAANKHKMLVLIGYRTRAIISCGLYIFTPYFTAVYNNLCTKQENSLKKPWLIIINQERFQIKSGL